MNLIVCLDDNGGMMFGGRRQTRDRLVNRHILEMTKGHLIMTEGSAKMFRALPEELEKDGVSAEDTEALRRMAEQIRVEPDPLSAAGPGDFVFDEDMPPGRFADRIRTLVICRWNRVYPADLWFDLDLPGPWTRRSVQNITGSSHDPVTIEVYE
ncbi:hypothetical protein ACTNEM_04695 [Eubacterium pyruvativorans]|uniref:hypothetical protein n=1 Tax=Eubacterium pyruvativorans TaxID=155865 RepID=UPI00240A17BB|nr:hypothetical protein [Eubacterium pyruvativorans]MDD6708166.1 hypothetical protein [Eubacterium pyruvativorans]